jgi:hypothetical protein
MGIGPFPRNRQSGRGDVTKVKEAVGHHSAWVEPALGAAPLLRKSLLRFDGLPRRGLVE